MGARACGPSHSRPAGLIVVAALGMPAGAGEAIAKRETTFAVLSVTSVGHGFDYGKALGN